MDKLIQMTDFVLQRNEINGEDYYGYEKTAVECINYAKFLKQSLTLGMFVPCDEESNVLFKGFLMKNGTQEIDQYTTYLIQKETECVVGYKKEWKDEWDFFGDAIEDLITYGLTLTPSALKAIGIE